MWGGEGRGTSGRGEEAASTKCTTCWHCRAHLAARVSGVHVVGEGGGREGGQGLSSLLLLLPFAAAVAPVRASVVWGPGPLLPSDSTPPALCEAPPAATAAPTRARVHHVTPAAAAGPLDNVRGLDVGCGANYIYCLLGASLFGWHMVGSDITQVRRIAPHAPAAFLSCCIPFLPLSLSAGVAACRSCAAAATGIPPLPPLRLSLLSRACPAFARSLPRDAPASASARAALPPPPLPNRSRDGVTAEPARHSLPACHCTAP